MRLRARRRHPHLRRERGAGSVASQPPALRLPATIAGRGRIEFRAPSTVTRTRPYGQHGMDIAAAGRPPRPRPPMAGPDRGDPRNRAGAGARGSGRHAASGPGAARLLLLTHRLPASSPGVDTFGEQALLVHWLDRIRSDKSTSQTFRALAVAERSRRPGSRACVAAIGCI